VDSVLSVRTLAKRVHGIIRRTRDYPGFNYSFMLPGSWPTEAAAFTKNSPVSLVFNSASLALACDCVRTNCRKSDSSLSLPLCLSSRVSIQQRARKRASGNTTSRLLRSRQRQCGSTIVQIFARGQIFFNIVVMIARDRDRVKLHAGGLFPLQVSVDYRNAWR